MMTIESEKKYTPDPARTFGRLVPECKAVGICKSRAYTMAADGTLDTFKLGRATYVYLESLRTLPERLAEVSA